MTNLARALAPLLSDLASSIFFAALIWVTNDTYVATAGGIAVGVVQFAYEKLRRRPVPVMQWMSLLLVVVFGGLSLYLHDPRFIIAKFTIAKIAIGVAMLTPNWMSRYLPKIVSDTLSAAELTFYSALWPVMMFGLAAANLYIGFAMGEAAWKLYVAYVPGIAPWVLFGLEYVTIRLRVRSILRRGAVPAVA